MFETDNIVFGDKKMSSWEKQQFLKAMPTFLPKVKKTLAKKTLAKMDGANKAVCYALRHPGKGKKPTPFKTLQ